jgi:hypothetical protein
MRGADDWRYKDGTKLRKVVLPDGTEVDAEDEIVSDEVYYIVPENVRNVKDFMMTSVRFSMSSRFLFK